MLKKVLLSIIFGSLFFINSIQAQEMEFSGIGAELYKDPYSNKVIITRVIPATPAQIAGLKVGDIIVAVNGKKIKNSCLCEVISNIRGEENTRVTLTIKEGLFKKKDVEIVRQLISYYHPDFDEKFLSHWLQIAPMEHAYESLVPIVAAKKLSAKFQKFILPQINYWFERRENFEIGYATCLNYSKEQQEYCLVHLLDREAQKTSADKMIYKFLRKQK